MCCLYVLIFIFHSSFCRITIVILVSALGVHVACTCRMEIHVSRHLTPSTSTCNKNWIKRHVSNTRFTYMLHRDTKVTCTVFFFALATNCRNSRYSVLNTNNCRNSRYSVLYYYYWNQNDMFRRDTKVSCAGYWDDY